MRPDAGKLQQPIRKRQPETIERPQPELTRCGDQDQAFDLLGVLERIFRRDGAAERMPHQDDLSLNLEHIQGNLHVQEDPLHFIATAWAV